MRSSVRRHGRLVRVTLQAEEAELLVDLSAGVVELLEEDAPPAAGSLEELLETSARPVPDPADPALARLLPAAYQDDVEAAQDFRRLTDNDLRTAKRASLARLGADLTPSGGEFAQGVVQVDLDQAAAIAWMYALTDIRLVYGTRINVTDDTYDELRTLDPHSTRFDQLVDFDWLGGLLDAIVIAVTDG